MIDFLKSICDVFFYWNIDNKDEDGNADDGDDDVTFKKKCTEYRWLFNLKDRFICERIRSLYLTFHIMLSLLSKSSDIANHRGWQLQP